MYLPHPVRIACLLAALAPCQACAPLPATLPAGNAAATSGKPPALLPIDQLLAATEGAETQGEKGTATAAALDARAAALRARAARLRQGG